MQSVIRGATAFESEYRRLVRKLLGQQPFDRGEVHAQKTTTPEMVTLELRHVTQHIELPHINPSPWQDMIHPNLPWAEDHFQERVGGEPLNPPPAEAWWPYAQQGNAAHKDGEKFSHTYPERFWPRFANEGGTMKHNQRVVATPIVGIRYEYGDLTDLVNILRRNPRSRQAYLPVWFPEDLNAADHGDRVPCTLGYHFLLTPEGRLDCTYNMRSCDVVRFYRDDVYMAGRLLQWVSSWIKVMPGTLVMHINNLHCFEGDRATLNQLIDTPVEDKRNNYNFGALM